jgi:1-deoxy-D-xylulose-5-phosphate reductoisomerase
MKSLAILGATGSIGRNTLDIVQKFPHRYQVKALTAKSNVDLLAEQVQTFKPESAAVYDRQSARMLKERLPAGWPLKILYGPEGYQAVATWDGVDMVVGAMVGAAGLEPTLAAIESGKDIALANKEPLVMAGPLVMGAVRRKGVQLLPVDSEHSAIFQCLQGQRRQDLDKIILTASGGPFRRTPEKELDLIRPIDALKHPNWRMGSKITIDSATLMNKGLEVIEAKWLFDLSIDQIEVMVHPQSIVHSMVAYCDGSLIAQMGIPDMQVAIAYALSFPERLPLKQPLPDLVDLQSLTFEMPDLHRFPCLRLAYDVIHAGDSLPTVLNAANEVAVHAFLDGKISFRGIYDVIQATLDSHHVQDVTNLEAIMAADRWARRKARKKVEHIARI